MEVALWGESPTKAQGQICPATKKYFGQKHKKSDGKLRIGELLSYFFSPCLGVERISYRWEAVKVVGFDSPSSPQQFLELHCSCWCVCFWGSKRRVTMTEGVHRFPWDWAEADNNEVPGLKGTKNLEIRSEVK
jgi:hypothetical protein